LTTTFLPSTSTLSWITVKGGSQLCRRLRRRVDARLGVDHVHDRAVAGHGDHELAAIRAGERHRAGGEIVGIVDAFLELRMEVLPSAHAFAQLNEIHLTPLRTSRPGGGRPRPPLHDRFDERARGGIVDGRTCDDPGLPLLDLQPDHLLRVSQHRDVGVVRGGEDLPAILAAGEPLLITQDAHHVLVDETAVEVVLGLVQHQNASPQGEQEQPEGSRSLAH
jgi:hypothetical protein